MSDFRPRGLEELSARVAQRGNLDQGQLVGLIEDLHHFALRQQETVDRQSAAIQRLQSRVGSSAAPASEPTPRPIASAVPGADFTIVFDGGAIGNPGRGYGSYQIVGADGVVAEARLEYGDDVTNNQAEFLTIIRALEALRDQLAAAAPRTSIAIRGDSQLVLNTISGRWKARHPGLVPLHQQATALLREFDRADIKWQPRSKSVAVLGH